MHRQARAARAGRAAPTDSTTRDAGKRIDRPQDDAPDARLLPVALQPAEQRRRVAQPDEPRRLAPHRPRTDQRPRPAPARMPRSTRSPSLPSSAGRTVSEPTSAVKTTSIAPMPIDVKIFEPGEEHPGHRDQHGDARDQHGLPGGRGGAEEAVITRCGPPRVPRARASSRRASSRRRPPSPSAASPTWSRRTRARDGSTACSEPDRREHGGEREQHGHAGGDERAEREEQDQERDRHGEPLRLLEVLADRVVQLLRRAREAELGDREARVRVLQRSRPRRAPAAPRRRPSSIFPSMSNWTSCACAVPRDRVRRRPSARRFVTCGIVPQLRGDVARSRRGMRVASTVSVVDSTSTLSEAGCLEARVRRGSPAPGQSRPCPAPSP